MRGIGNPVFPIASIGVAIVGIIAVLLFTGTALNYTGNFIDNLKGAGNPYIIGAVIIIVIVIVVFIVKGISES